MNSSRMYAPDGDTRTPTNALDSLPTPSRNGMLCPVRTSVINSVLRHVPRPLPLPPPPPPLFSLLLNDTSRGCGPSQRTPLAAASLCADSDDRSSGDRGLISPRLTVNTARAPVLVGPAPTNTHSAASAAAAAVVESLPADVDGLCFCCGCWWWWWCLLLVGSSRGQGCSAMVVRPPGSVCSRPTSWGSTDAGTALVVGAFCGGVCVVGGRERHTLMQHSTGSRKSKGRQQPPCQALHIGSCQTLSCSPYPKTQVTSTVHTT